MSLAYIHQCHGKWDQNYVLRYFPKEIHLACHFHQDDEPSVDGGGDEAVDSEETKADFEYSNVLLFYLNGKRVEERDPPVHLSLLEYLRQRMYSTVKFSLCLMVTVLCRSGNMKLLSVFSFDYRRHPSAQRRSFLCVLW